MLAVDDDVGKGVTLAGQAADAHRGAHRVQIRIAVAHDQHAGGIPHQFGQGIGHDAGLDLGAFLHLQAAPAVEFKVQPVFDDHLVAAAGQGQIHRHIGELQALGQVLGLLAEADADGGVDTAGALHLMDLLGDAELVLLHPFQILLLDHDDVAVPVIAPQDRVVRAAPVVEPVLHRVTDLVLHALGVVAAHLIQVVDDDHAGHRTALGIAGADLVILGGIHPIGDAHEHRLLLGFVGVDQVAVHLVFPAVEFDKAGIDLLALGEPFARELRVQVHHAQVHTPFFGAEEVKKALISPDNAAVIQAEHRDGQGEMEKRAVLGVLGLIGDALDISVQLFGPGTLGHQSIDAQHHDDRAFRRRQIIHLEEYGAGHKKDHKQ